MKEKKKSESQAINKKGVKILSKLAIQREDIFFPSQFFELQ